MGIRRREPSTSSLEEKRKPLLDQWMFERRLLLGCTFLVCLSLIMWIVAIATDHWIIISGNGGIFIPETRRFFLRSNQGLWRMCRVTSTPAAVDYEKVAINVTSIAFKSTTNLNNAKLSLSETDKFKDILRKNFTMPQDNFTDLAKDKMFAYYLINDTEKLNLMKDAFKKLVMSKYNQKPKKAKAQEIDATNLKELYEKKILGKALIKVVSNNTTFNLVIPEACQESLSTNWTQDPTIPKMVFDYCLELDIPPIVLNNDAVILQLVPPKPPKKGTGKQGYYDYTKSEKCWYIDMFPSDESLEKDLAFDEEVLDYIRTQASFACITVAIMTMGSVFSFYTFMNPRYMFKRLAGGIHFISAATSVVVLQVLFASVDYTKANLLYTYPEDAELTYGFGIYLAWFVFGINLFAGILFMWYSGKKKGAKAPTDEIAMADEAVAMGR